MVLLLCLHNFPFAEQLAVHIAPVKGIALGLWSAISPKDFWRLVFNLDFNFSQLLAGQLEEILKFVGVVGALSVVKLNVS